MGKNGHARGVILERSMYFMVTQSYRQSCIYEYKSHNGTRFHASQHVVEMPHDWWTTERSLRYDRSQSDKLNKWIATLHRTGDECDVDLHSRSPVNIPNIDLDVLFARFTNAEIKCCLAVSKMHVY